MSTSSFDFTYADEPREKHYVMAHVALREMSQQDPHYFFGIMASEEQREFIADIGRQVDANHPNAKDDLELEMLQVFPSQVNKHPVLLIKMPPVKAYSECVYLGIVLLVDMYHPQQTADPKIRFFTLELGEAVASAEKVGYFLCEWRENQHLSLAEIPNNCSVEEFGMLIQHQFETTDS